MSVDGRTHNALKWPLSHLRARKSACTLTPCALLRNGPHDAAGQRRTVAIISRLSGVLPAAACEGNKCLTKSVNCAWRRATQLVFLVKRMPAVLCREPIQGELDHWALERACPELNAYAPTMSPKTPARTSVRQRWSAFSLAFG